MLLFKCLSIEMVDANVVFIKKATVVIFTHLIVEFSFQSGLELHLNPYIVGIFFLMLQRAVLQQQQLRYDALILLRSYKRVQKKN